MGKLTSIQQQVQDSVETAIETTEKTYITLAAKPFELSNKLHSLHDDGVASLADLLRDLNKQVGKFSSEILSKFEKEETKTEKAKTEKAKRVVNNTGKKTRKPVNKKAAEAKKAVKEMADAVEDATA